MISKILKNVKKKNKITIINIKKTTNYPIHLDKKMVRRCRNTVYNSKK